MKLDRYDKDCYRVVQAGVIVGFALRLSNDKWSACDLDAFRLTRRQFGKPTEVRDWFATRPTPSEDQKRDAP